MRQRVRFVCVYMEYSLQFIFTWIRVHVTIIAIRYGTSGCVDILENDFQHTFQAFKFLTCHIVVS